MKKLLQVVLFLSAVMAAPPQVYAEAPQALSNETLSAPAGESSPPPETTDVSDETLGVPDEAPPVADEPEDVSAETPEVPAQEEDWSFLPDNGPGEEMDQDRVFTGTEYFSLAEQSYEAGDYDRAREYYTSALGSLDDDKLAAKSHERLAFIYAAFGESEKVYEEFVLSLRLDPSLELDPELVSPKVYEGFTRARDEVVREGVLVVNCDPPGACVLLSGETIGDAPVRKERVKEGEYQLVLTKPGYEMSTTIVTIKKDVTLTIDEKLTKARGTLEITTTPPGVQILLDGRPEGATPLVLENVSGGKHVVSIKREYFEPLEAEIDMEKGEAATFSAQLKRRVLVITADDQALDAMRLVEGPFSEMAGMSFVVSGIDELKGRLSGRGLDPGSIEFILDRKTALTLEDAAVLSGVMEDSRAELALFIQPRASEDGYELDLALYSTASVFGDRVTLTAGDADDAAGRFEDFLAGWRGVTEPYRVSSGLRVVDRASGGVEVISVVPGLPAAEAGLLPGDIIKSLDGKQVAANADFAALLTEGTHKLAYARNGKEHKGELAAGLSPVETPLDSGEYLYNLGLVEFSGYLKGVPPPAEGLTDDIRAAAALNLGNVYQRMGEYPKAVEAYAQAKMSATSGICTGTALFRAGEAYERMGQWAEAAGAYRKAMLLYPGATIESADGQPVAPLAKERLEWLFSMGLTKERWWM